MFHSVIATLHALAWPAMRHWGTSKVNFQLVNFSWHCKAA